MAESDTPALGEDHLCVQQDGWQVNGEDTACHDMALYGPCGHEHCSGQDDYIGMCTCVCHEDGDDQPTTPALGDIVVHTAYLNGVPSRAVVTQADQHSLISFELLAAPAADIEGAMTQDGDLVSFGTDGYGLGRVTYRIVARNSLWVVVEREA